jgi:hypothetical protein
MEPSDRVNRPPNGHSLIRTKILMGLGGLIACFLCFALIGALLQRKGAAETDDGSGSHPSARTEGPKPVGAGLDKYIEGIRRGVLGSPYDTTTVGAAFEATFTNCRWKSNMSSKGERFVEFTGRLKPEMYQQAFDRIAKAEYQSCLAAPAPENPIKAWYAGKMTERLPCCQDGAHDSNGNSCSARIDPGGSWDENHHWRWATSARSSFYAISCQDRDGRQFDASNINTLPPEPKPSCGNPPDEVAYSTVTFQFLFTADEQSFRLGYFDPKPWEHTSLNTYKITGTTKHCTTFRDGTCNAQWTSTRGTYDTTAEDVLTYIYK